ncbi:dual specificity protein phosphatase 23-like [Maniola hyperantus]|uniref:dual specificity protein phosphatase 23-like n=1 Tax=Aphantopus hyperantus TaxID=2795564 RepID=UPI001569A4A4|nr:dual specificity protein phosphatase 23-like [Maniola hyperantus]XP_034826121.1 dual specificity protein phosphatase 23-like [Maniola hyperantus]
MAEAYEEYYPVYTRMEDITEQDDRHLAGARKEIRNDLTVIIPENPFPEIAVDAYPPLKFSWVIPKKLAAMAFPRHIENLQFLVNQGITHLVTLTAGKKPPVDDIPSLRWTEIPIEEFEAPTVEQIEQFVDVCKRSDKNGEVMGLHCRQGRSRSGVMLACYLVHFHRFLPDQAINVIRMIRPGSLFFEEQEEAVGRYFEHLTENNPLRFGVSGDVMEEFIEVAKEATKQAL